MHRFSVRQFGFAIVAFATMGCASTQGYSQNLPKFPPARLVRIGSMDPTLPSGRRPTPVDVNYEIVIRADGSPDFSTLKILGKGALEMKNAITDWIGASAFEPSKVNGVPVMSLFKGGIKSSIRAM